ncbi:MAG: DUF1385 domain-containing protein [Firmicutes bacterium]|nr:DUF1385 domain-containing protein [Bacillota bacterium]
MDKNKNLGKGIGGQAVIEGVMMRGKTMYSLAVRNPQKGISVEKTPIKKSKEKSILTLPLIRGVVSFVSSLVIGMKVTTRSAELAGLDDIEYDKDSKFERWLEKTFGDKLADYAIGFSVCLSIALCIAIFMVLPTFLGGLATKLLGGDATLRSVLEGIIRILIFIVYLVLIAQMKDIKRTFMYHGAEHKTINCFESDEELTVENVRKHTRFHKRCGTSFLVLVMLVSMVVFFFIRTDILWLRVLSRILLVPVISGISYEIIRWAGRHDNWLVNIVSAPGISMQLITTSEPDDSMIEVAIASLKAVLEEEPEEKEEADNEKKTA